MNSSTKHTNECHFLFSSITIYLSIFIWWSSINIVRDKCLWFALSNLESFFKWRSKYLLWSSVSAHGMSWSSQRCSRSSLFNETSLAFMFSFFFVKRAFIWSIISTCFHTSLAWDCSLAFPLLMLWIISFLTMNFPFALLSFIRAPPSRAFKRHACTLETTDSCSTHAVSFFLTQWDCMSYRIATND